MKKIITLAFAVTFFFGCSSSSSNNENLDLGYMKFNLQNTFNFSDEGVFIGTQWAEYVNNDGSIEHEISSTVSRIGNNVNFSNDFIDFRFSFTVTQPLTVNQIIPINLITFDNNIYQNISLPYNNNVYDLVDVCNLLFLEKQNTTTGFVKITQIDNSNGYIKGIFEFNSLKSAGGGNTCQNYPTQQNYNIINGEFKAYN